MNHLMEDRYWEQKHNNAVQEAEYLLFAILKPDLAESARDRWMVTYRTKGKSIIQGVGKSPYLAILDFNRQWHKTLDK